MTSPHFMTMRPGIEILAVADEAGRTLGEIGAAAATSAAATASYPLILHHYTPGVDDASATGVDLVALASNVSAEAWHIIRASTLLSRQARTSKLLLLLTTGGVFVYLLYKSGLETVAEDDDETKDDKAYKPPSSSRLRSPPSRGGWLWWLFGFGDSGESALLQDIRGRNSVFFRGGSRANFKKSSPLPKNKSNPSLLQVPQSECKQCAKGVCRVKIHMLRKYSENSNESESSHETSPLRMNQQVLDLGSSRCPATSTPELADDEMSPEDELTPKARKSTVEQPLSTPKKKKVSKSAEAVDYDPRCHFTPVQQQPRPPRRGSIIRSSTFDRTAQIYSSSRSNPGSASSRRFPRRIPPEGRERWSLSPVTALPKSSSTDLFDPLNPSNNQQPLFVLSSREQSVDSLPSVSGSMADIVRGAKEIRAMIRDASMSSIATGATSDLAYAQSLYGDEDEQSMLWYSDIHQINEEISQLIENCDRLDRDDQNLLPTSKSDFGLARKATEGKSNNEEELSSLESSIPDLRRLTKRPNHRNVWRLTTGGTGTPISQDLDASSIASPDSSPRLFGSHRRSRYQNLTHSTSINSMEWDSPQHGWHDPKEFKYKLALSSKAGSEADFADRQTEDKMSSLNYDQEWEWDSENFDVASASLAPHFSMLNHQNWLPERVGELDLEAELAQPLSSLSLSSRSSSRRPSIPDIQEQIRARSGSQGSACGYLMKRQPPSGRSSIDRGLNEQSEEVSKEPSKKANSKIMSASFASSVESGFQEGVYSNSSSMVTSVNEEYSTSEQQQQSSSSYLSTGKFNNSSSGPPSSSNQLPLSPVREVKEPGSTPKKKSHGALEKEQQKSHGLLETKNQKVVHDESKHQTTPVNPKSLKARQLNYKRSNQSRFEDQDEYLVLKTASSTSS